MTLTSKSEDFEVHESAVTAVGSAITLDGIPVHLPHCFAGVHFFADAAGTTPATPGAGTIAITAKTINNGVYESVGGSSINATAPTTLSWSGNTQSVKATPTGVTTATHYKLVVTANEN